MESGNRVEESAELIRQLLTRAIFGQEEHTSAGDNVSHFETERTETAFHGVFLRP